MIAVYNPKVKIEIDGRISEANIEKYGKNIVDIFACGTTCLNHSDIKGSVDKLFELHQSIIKEGI
jgi:pentose-5-phosphate-3-epimerase